jgi:alpha-ketoglutarate-dependent taurine dioxygenase
MGYETINVTPVTPRIGAEVDGLTLAKPLSNRQVEELHQALAEHQVEGHPKVSPVKDCKEAISRAEIPAPRPP